MIDEDDFQAVLHAALRDTGSVDDRAKRATPPSQAAEEGDESEMTSIMGPEERQLLQQATRQERQEAASGVVGEDGATRPTARPPTSGNEPPVLIGASASAGTVLPVLRQPDRGPRHLSLAWSLAPFIMLAAAAVYEMQR
jgi:hypothetical protein